MPVEYSEIVACRILPADYGSAPTCSRDGEQSPSLTVPADYGSAPTGSRDGEQSPSLTRTTSTYTQHTEPRARVKADREKGGLGSRKQFGFTSAGQILSITACTRVWPLSRSLCQTLLIRQTPRDARGYYELLWSVSCSQQTAQTKRLYQVFKPTAYWPSGMCDSGC